MGGRGGAVRAGCGVFSLVGLLLGVGLTVWLGSRMLDSSSPTSSAALTSTVAVDPSVELEEALSVQVAPSTALDEGATVTVTAGELSPGEGVTVVLCAKGTAAVTLDRDSCDVATEMTAMASATGQIEVRYPLARVVDVSGLPIDCAAGAGRCEVRVHGQTSSLTGAVPISFTADLGPPEVTVDLGG